MEKMGEGLQYTVYLDGNKVRKEPKSKSQMIKMARNWHDTEEEAVKNVEMALRRRKKTVQEIKNRNFPDWIFGNIRFDEDVVFQDLLTPVDGRLAEAKDLDQKKKVVEDYIELLQKLWSYGIGDTIYNFTLNNGYDQKGRLVQLDFGEIVFSSERVKEEVESQKWLEKRSYSHDISDDLKPYFKRRMEEEITVEKLEDKWREKC
jgi:hypothetical protein